MIDADDYVRDIEYATRRAVTDETDALVEAATHALHSAAVRLLDAAGCTPYAATHMYAAELVEAVLASLPWGDIADDCTAARGLTPIPSDGGRLYYHHIAK